MLQAVLVRINASLQSLLAVVVSWGWALGEPTPRKASLHLEMLPPSCPCLPGQHEPPEFPCRRGILGVGSGGAHPPEGLLALRDLQTVFVFRVNVNLQNLPAVVVPRKTSLVSFLVILVIFGHFGQNSCSLGNKGALFVR